MKNILITGGAKRIGAKIAYTISNLQFKKNLIIHYNSSHDEALKLKESLINKNTEVFLFQADFTKIEQIKNLIEFTRENFGFLNVLINNASIFQKNDFISADDSQFMNYLNVHLTATFLLSKFLLNSQNLQRDKIIINMLDERRSFNDKIQNYGNYFYYSMTKHMMFLMHQYLQKELGKSHNIKIYGILLSLVLPNSIDAEYFKKNHIEQKNIDEKLLRISEVIKEIFLNNPESKDFII